MYLNYYNFREEPFNITPDPKFYFLSNQHEAAIESLLYGIESRRGFMTLIGDVGTGKTTTCRTLLNRLPKNVDTSLIFNPMLSILELLQSINDDFDNKDAVKDTVKGQIDALNNFLLRRLRWGKNAVVIIDEAQNLSIEAMEMMRLLSNLETDNKKLLQIIFIGQNELIPKLSAPDLRQLNQRIIIRCRLTPLAYPDLVRYVEHRLQVASFNGQATVKFAQKALLKIYEYCQGTPRLANLLCDRLLMEGFAEKTNLVNVEMVKNAILDLEQPLSLAGAVMKKKESWQIWKNFFF
ncbi:MAG: AAA family ATPase [Pseudomonadota bacterium]